MLYSLDISLDGQRTTVKTDSCLISDPFMTGFVKIHDYKKNEQIVHKVLVILASHYANKDYKLFAHGTPMSNILLQTSGPYSFPTIWTILTDFFVTVIFIYSSNEFLLASLFSVDRKSIPYFHTGKPRK